MKKMNLLPLAVKQKRQSKKNKQKALGVSLIPGIFLAQTLLSLYLMENKKWELQENINEAKEIESQITQEQALIDKNRAIINNLANGGLPLNQFLLFTGLSIPEDMRLYSVATRDYIEEELGEEAQAGQDPASNPAEPTEPIVMGGETQTETAGAAEGGEAPPETNSPQSDQPASAQNQPVASTETANHEIVVRGAALNLNSIGLFMGELKEKNGYIEQVDIVNVENYYNGAFNYKMFEIVVKLQQ